MGSAQNDYAQKVKDSRSRFDDAIKHAASDLPGSPNAGGNTQGGKASGELPNKDLSGLPIADLLQGEYSQIITDKALPQLNVLASALRETVSAPGPIKDAEAAADAFRDVMAKVPEPNVETSDATHLGDTILDRNDDAGAVPEARGAGPTTGTVPTAAGGAALGAAGGAILGVAGQSGMLAATRPGVETTGVGVTGDDGSHNKVPGGSPGLGPILDDADAQRAAQQLDKLSPADRQRFEQLLNNGKSSQEQAYLMKPLAAGHSVDEITSFDNLIHNHGDDPAWLQEHLTPMTNGDDQHPDLTIVAAHGPKVSTRPPWRRRRSLHGRLWTRPTRCA